MEERRGGTPDGRATRRPIGLCTRVVQARGLRRAHAAIGLATPYLYNLPAGATRDVGNPPSGVGNPVSGDPNAFMLYYGSRYSGKLFTPTFNQDSSLAVGAGWDDVTGVGTPYAPSFVSALGQ